MKCALQNIAVGALMLNQEIAAIIALAIAVTIGAKGMTERARLKRSPQAP